jgi:type II secretory pathway pseudopilin PulG
METTPANQATRCLRRRRFATSRRQRGRRMFALRAAFSLVEALVALAITAVAGAALLVSLNSNILLTEHTENRVIAQGMARQLMDEVLGTRYMALGSTPYQYPFTPSSWELQTGTRERFDDVDDYHGWSTMPPVDEFNVLLGTENGAGGQRKAAFRVPANRFQRWQQKITVSYVNSTNLAQSLSGSSTSDYRAVEVSILYDDPQHGLKELARIRRIVSYVSPVE